MSVPAEASEGAHAARVAPPAPPRWHTRLAFDGDAGEYARIWIVNLLLTLFSLGLYSPWAKVRKARWFAQHTRLDGQRFDFTGEPRRILRGRVLALGLLVAWTWSFQLHPWAGLGVTALLLAVGPGLFVGAQRFRLANSRWRGLNFGYAPGPTEARVVVALMVLMWGGTSILGALDAGQVWWLTVVGLTTLGLPWLHARLKRLQHERASFAGSSLRFVPATGAFYGLYVKALLLALLGLIPLSVAMGSLSAAMQASNADAQAPWLSWLTAGLTTLLLWLVVWPYFAARAQQIVWSHTRWRNLSFAGHMRSGTLWKLVWKHTLLTIATLGLWWPRMAVALARYRIESIEVEALDGGPPDFDALVDAGGRGQPHALGDAVADAFGLDLGW